MASLEPPTISSACYSIHNSVSRVEINEDYDELVRWNRPPPLLMELERNEDDWRRNVMAGC